MQIDRYAQKSFAEVVRWKEHLEREDRAALRRSFDALGDEGMMVFEQRNKALLQKLVQSAPREAKRQLQQLADESTRHTAVLLCYRWAHCGHLLLEMMSTHGLDPSYDAPVRMLTAQAGYIAAELPFVVPPYWPFSDEDNPEGPIP